MTKKNASLRRKARAGSVPCNHCPATFDNAADNRNHQEKEHADILSTCPHFHCERCGSYFNNKEVSKKHECPCPAGISSKELDKMLIQAFREKKKKVW